MQSFTQPAARLFGPSVQKLLRALLEAPTNDQLTKYRVPFTTSQEPKF